MQSENLQKIPTHTASAQAAARWLVHCEVLQQFQVAREVELEDTTNYTALLLLER